MSLYSLSLDYTQRNGIVGINGGKLFSPFSTQRIRSQSLRKYLGPEMRYTHKEAKFATGENQAFVEFETI